MTKSARNTRTQRGSSVSGGQDSRRPETAGRTPELDFRPAILRLPDGLGAPGYLILGLILRLTVGLTKAKKIYVPLGRTLARLIFALHEALKADEDMPDDLRGWLSAKRLLKAIAAQDPRLIELKPGTIVHYVCDINRYVRLAAEEQGFRVEDRNSLKIIQTRNGWGYKLALPRLVIIKSSG